MLRKEEIRQQIKRRKRQFTEEQLRELSLAIIDRLLDHPRIKKAKRILMYYSLPDEVYTHEAIIQLVNEGKEVFLPVVLDNFEMELHKFSRKDNMSEGAFNIMEPIGHKYTNFDSIDVAVIPAIAYDEKNNRLGRGKGYYDRFLAKIPLAYKTGICFDFQKITDMPVDNNDVPVDEVI